MQQDRVNRRYLPDIALPDALEITANLPECIREAQAVLLATPSGAFAETLKQILAGNGAGLPIVWACKGLEKGSARLLEHVAGDILGSETPLAMVSGPSFAGELMRGLPTAITVASRHQTFADQLVNWLHSDTFRAYRTDDLTGVEIGGALKNVFAIAAGISDGLGFGANARAALITRGLAELMRLGVALGGRAETFMGLAGMGDLVLTCTDDQSRNRRMGLALARGLGVEQAREEIGQAVEGVNTAREAQRLSQSHGIEMPIAEQVYAVLHEGKPAAQAVRDLLNRGPRSEVG